MCGLFIGNVFANTYTAVNDDSGSFEKQNNGSSKEKLTSSIVASDATFRAPIPGMTNSAGYMTLENQGSEVVTFVAARSNVSETVEFHDHIMNNGVMRMTKVDKIVIEPNESINFESGGLHLMFFGLKAQNISDKAVEVFLITTQGNEIKVRLNVESVHDHHQHH